MGVFIFFDCCDKNLIVLSRQLLIPLNSSKDDNSFVIIFLFLKFEIFVLFLLPTVKKIVYILFFININEIVTVFKLFSKIVLPQMNIVICIYLAENNAAFSLHYAFS
jgi:hypothetical protein